MRGRRFAFEMSEARNRWGYGIAGVTALGLMACGPSPLDEEAPTAVRVILDYLPNAIHAGLYVAEAVGDFSEADLAVKVHAPTTTSDTLRLMAAGQAEIGLVSLFDFHQARSRGVPIKMVGAIVQEPLGAILSRDEFGVLRPADLAGKLVGISGVPSDTFALEWMVAFDGGTVDSFETVTIGFNTMPNLIAGNVQAAYGFWNYEGVQLMERGDGVVLRLVDYGAPRYPEIVLFAREDYLAENGRTVRDFLEALEKGYRAVLNDSEAALETLARSLEGETAASLRPYLAGLLPVFADEEGAVLRLDLETLTAFAEWVTASGVLVIAEPVSAYATNEYVTK